MAGLYIHIPFCRDACTYCDFHFSISLGQLDPMLEAINLELQKEKDYLEGESLSTIYLGGGTPSLLSTGQLEKIFSSIRDQYSILYDAEITLEANPDDLDPAYLNALLGIGINRLSIGIQSFHEKDLHLMNRRHTSSQARACIENAYTAGFSNLNLDLIYGLPGMDTESWKQNLRSLLSFKPAHIAAYHLTYEKGTILDYRMRKKKVNPSTEDNSYEHYKTLCLLLGDAGYEHYEISNFALPGMVSRHNSAYWKGDKYLGVGPSAHSFNGLIRRWNIPRNSSYIRGIKDGISVHQEEKLGDKDQFHDYLLTALRTSWGLDLDRIRKEWKAAFYEHLVRESKPFVESGKIIQKGNTLRLTEEGMFLADHILQKLFMDS